MKLLFLILVACISVQVQSEDLSERKEHIQKMETKVSTLAAKRKLRSESILRKDSVPINDYLPFIEDESEALVRTKEDVATRALALLVIAVKAEGLEQETVERLINIYGLKDALSPDEVKFIKDQSPSQHDNTQFVWRYEAAWVLLWSLGYVDNLAYPNAICDVPMAIAFMQERNKNQFIADARLRSASDILDEADVIYRYHWAVVDARINDKPSPAELDSSVVLERHYALNWLIGYMGQEWDDISTDT